MFSIIKKVIIFAFAIFKGVKAEKAKGNDIVGDVLSLFKKNEPNLEKESKRNPIRGRAVLTLNEQPTFLRLREALPEHFVLAQVAFSGFMTAGGYATRNLFNRKVADFVVLDKNFNVVAIVELDDSSHKGREDIDQERDELIKEAGYKVIRYKRTPDIDQIHFDFGITEKNSISTPIEPERAKTKLVSDAFIVQTESSDKTKSP